MLEKSEMYFMDDRQAAHTEVLKPCYSSQARRTVVSLHLWKIFPEELRQPDFAPARSSSNLDLLKIVYQAYFSLSLKSSEHKAVVLNDICLPAKPHLVAPYIVFFVGSNVHMSAGSANSLLSNQIQKVGKRKYYDQLSWRDKTGG